MCSVCLTHPCDDRCPSAPEPQSALICAFCAEGIMEWEEYVEIKGRPYHEECLSVDIVLGLLGIPVHEGGS